VIKLTQKRDHTNHLGVPGKRKMGCKERSAGWGKKEPDKQKGMVKDNQGRVENEQLKGRQKKACLNSHKSTSFRERKGTKNVGGRGKRGQGLDGQEGGGALKKDPSGGTLTKIHI